MDFFISQKVNSTRWRFKWHVLFAFLVVLSLIFSAMGAAFGGTEEKTGKLLLYLAGGILLLALAYAVFVILLLVYETVKSLKDAGEKMDNATEMLTRQSSMLLQIAQGVRLSDTAREIVFRDAEQMELGEAALNKLHQHDFDEAEAMIEAMAQYPKYKDLAARLKRMAERYRSSTEEGRINQIIAHIEDLFSQYRWAQAAVQIDNLIKTFPYSDRAKMMPARLQEHKDRRKRELLAEWDLAVRNKDTDRSLEILKELDLYLTPAEALALKESAASVFRTKLHNLGVEFSMAVAEKNWKKALDTGKEIVQNFPNSRMAAEIRSKMDILQERARTEAKEEKEKESA